MEIIDRVNPRFIRFEKIRRREELLDSTPRLSPHFSSRKVIDFGNTGFDISFGTDVNYLDFMPEGETVPRKQTTLKYAYILRISLLELHNLLNNPEKMHEFGVGESKITIATAYTKKPLRDAIEGLFSKSDIPNLSSKDEKSVSIDLQGFKSLGKDNPLIKYLNRVSERAKNITIKD